jgi:phosphoenolpyruvate carboxykinase (ATP)
MITAALEGKLDSVVYHSDPIFGVQIPGSCPNVPYEILDARNTWADKKAFEAKAQFLANAFTENFEQFADFASPDILAGAPKVNKKPVLA